MNLSAIFIKRPIATTLLALGLALLGATAFMLLPVSSLPQIEFPTLNVQAILPGASPEIMATSVATPLERQLGRIAGITQMTSASSLGSSNITVQFDLSRDINGAARDVEAAINAARSQLPTNLPGNPTYRKINPAESPVLILALTSEQYSVGEMYDTASSLLQQKLSQIDGVGQVIIGGGSLPAVRVELNPTALNQYGISLQQVSARLGNDNVNRPTGQLSDRLSSSQIFTNDQLKRASQYKPMIIRWQNGAPVRLSDVAQIKDSVEDIRTAGFFDGKPAIAIVIFKQPNVNVIKTVDRVREQLPELQALIPAAMQLHVVMDRTTTIRASLFEIEMTLIIAVLLVIAVVYFFLWDVRSALIPSVAVPLSLLGTFVVMYAFGYSLDNLSLLALTISTGFLVDDAVVVLENTQRHIEAGTELYAAAMLGAREVGFTVLSMSLSLIAVFIPILLMGSIVGRLFREFAVTLSAAILVSMVVSLTVTPMMCARLLHRENNVVERKKRAGWGTIERISIGYQHSLTWALRHVKGMLLLTLFTFLATVALFWIIPKGFFPQQDTGRIMASIQAQQDISFQALKQKLKSFVTIINRDPAVEHVIGFIGGANNTSNVGRVFLTLKPLAQRKISSDEVIDRLRGKLAQVAGANIYLQSAQELLVGGRLGSAQYQYTLSAENLRELDRWAPLILARLQKLPHITDLNTDLQNHGLQTYVQVDRDTASRFGITAQTVDDVLYSAFGQRQVSIIYTPANQYHVVMEAAPQFWQQPASLHDIYVISAAGNKVPLATFASFTPSSTLLAVNHQNQFPSVTLSFNLAAGVSLGDVVTQIERIVNQMHLPVGLITNFQGTAQAFQAALATQPYLILAALATVYIVLGMLYESTIHPITILSTLPSAGVGALLALLLMHMEFNIIGLIGIFLLIGIVKKNAIMMVDFALEIERTEFKLPEQAIYAAATLRFRPIMMTTMAAMLGAVPLAFGFGVGAELRRPLGVAIIGGLIVSQLLTLYTTPVIYLTFARASQWLQCLRLSNKKKN